MSDDKKQEEKPMTYEEVITEIYEKLNEVIEKVNGIVEVLGNIFGKTAK